MWPELLAPVFFSFVGAVPVGYILLEVCREWRDERQADVEHFNSPDSRRLPPVECPLLIRVKGQVLRASRIHHIERPDDDMDYITDDGTLLVGRFWWTYP